MHGVRVFATDLFVPRYVPARHGAWALRVAGSVLAPGYWSPLVLFENSAALFRGDDLWMSLSALEFESQEIGIRSAQGHVLIFGLGMGWAAVATAMREAVTRVTVVERDPDVLALHRTLGIFEQLPPAARAKLAIVEGDAFAYRPDAPVDLLMPDIWLPLVSDGRVDEVMRMQANIGARAIYFWGQELEIARHAVAAGRSLDAAGIAATVAGWGLPLIGLGTPDYPERLAAATERWMRDRWLPAS